VLLRRLISSGAGLLLLVLVPLATGCAAPPQIVSILPTRGAGDVSTAEPIQITFNRPMDRPSVTSHFRLEPAVGGSVRWLDSQTMVFDHPPLRTDTQYQVFLDGGYRDGLGVANGLRHLWHFTTEAAPTLIGSTPAGGDRGVDPATYLALSFSRPMDLRSLASAISIGPTSEFRLEADPNDPTRVLIAPQGILYPNTSYTVTILPKAKDVHGNHLPQGMTTTFTTGARQPLQRTVGFLGIPTSAQAQPGAGVGSAIWTVNDVRFPRLLLPVQASSFSWSPDGTSVLVRGQGRTWSQVPVSGGTPTPLPFQGDWAAFMANGSFAFLDGTTLRVALPDGQTLDVATGVREAAVAPDGTTIAFVVDQGTGTEVDTYYLDYRARSRLQTAAGVIDQLAWAPDQQALAYRLSGGDPSQRKIEVRLLSGSGGTATLATGRVSSPQWQADGRHLFFQGLVDTQSGPMARVFRRGLGEQAGGALTSAGAMPTRSDLDIQSYAVSPDGREIAFLVGSGGRTSVWQMNSDGTGVVELASYDQRTFPYSAAALTWTPN
jgi:Bacterial Ig-like domain/WD40-like Beta Propeller Repeat